MRNKYQMMNRELPIYNKNSWKNYTLKSAEHYLKKINYYLLST